MENLEKTGNLDKKTEILIEKMDDVLDSQKVELTQDKQQDDLNKKEENVVKLGDKAMDWLEKTFRPKKNTAKKVDPLIKKLEQLIKN